MTSEAIDQLSFAPASEIKKQGWRGIMRSVSKTGKLVVTNHKQPEAVILSVPEYDRLIELAHSAKNRTNDPLQALRERFDQRLSSLNAADAADQLRNLMNQPAALSGKVKAGASY